MKPGVHRSYELTLRSGVSDQTNRTSVVSSPSVVEVNQAPSPPAQAPSNAPIAPRKKPVRRKSVLKSLPTKNLLEKARRAVSVVRTSTGRSSFKEKKEIWGQSVFDSVKPNRPPRPTQTPLMQRKDKPQLILALFDALSEPERAEVLEQLISRGSKLITHSSSELIGSSDTEQAYIGEPRVQSAPSMTTRVKTPPLALTRVKTSTELTTENEFDEPQSDHSEIDEQQPPQPEETPVPAPIHKVPKVKPRLKGPAAFAPADSTTLKRNLGRVAAVDEDDIGLLIDLASAAHLKAKKKVFTKMKPHKTKRGLKQLNRNRGSSFDSKPSQVGPFIRNLNTKTPPKNKIPTTSQISFFGSYSLDDSDNDI